MRQTLGEFDDRDEGFGLVGEERTDELPQRDRRLPMMLVTAFAMALFAGGLWFAYVEGTRHPAATARSEGVPLIRADQHPDKVRPEQPGGLKIPDQNVSIFNETPGGPPVEKLLPAPEQPMPRPAPEQATPRPAPAASAAISSPPPSANPPVAAPASPQASPIAKPAAVSATARQRRPSREAPHAKAAAITASAARAGRGTPVRVRARRGAQPRSGPRGMGPAEARAPRSLGQAHRGGGPCRSRRQGHLLSHRGRGVQRRRCRRSAVRRVEAAQSRVRRCAMRRPNPPKGGRARWSWAAPASG